MVKDGKAYAYAAWCLEDGNDRVPHYVKKQAASWIQIADGEDPDAIVDEKAVTKMEKLLKLMIHLRHRSLQPYRNLLSAMMP